MSRALLRGRCPVGALALAAAVLTPMTQASAAPVPTSGRVTPAVVAVSELPAAVSRVGSAWPMRRVRRDYPRGAAPRMEAAIRASWPTHLHNQALDVAWCESSGKASARNGQYRGYFQMGRKEWAKYGSGSPFDAHANVRAAYRYYRVAGWGPWQCQP